MKNKEIKGIIFLVKKEKEEKIEMRMKNILIYLNIDFFILV